MNLTIYQPWAKPGDPNGLSQALRDRLFMSSIEILEYTHMIKSESFVKQWSWLFNTYTQWHCIAFILGELALRDSSIVVERAWRIIEIEMKFSNGAISKTNPGMLWAPMRKLMLRARRKREENASNPPSTKTLGVDIPVPPPSRPRAPLSEEQALKEKLARDLFLAQMNGAVKSAVNQPLASYPTPTTSAEISNPGDILMVPLPLAEPLQDWSMDNGAVSDLDMQSLDGDVNWDAWQDLLRDFPIDTDMETGELRPVPFGGTGAW